MSGTALLVLFNGRRKQLRVGPGTAMSAVREDACREFGLAMPTAHALQHKRTVVDLTQPFRLTGIPQNATLELVPAASGTGGSGAGGGKGGEVRVGLRLPTGGRLQALFPPDTTLAAMLAQWADAGELDPSLLLGSGCGAGANGGGSSDGGNGAGPALQFMRQSYSGAELDATTLRAIGLISGSAMFVLSGGGGTGAGSVERAAVLAAANEARAMEEEVGSAAAKAAVAAVTDVGGAGADMDIAPPPPFAAAAAAASPSPSSALQPPAAPTAQPTPAAAVATGNAQAAAAAVAPAPAAAAAGATAAADPIAASYGAAAGNAASGGEGAVQRGLGTCERALEAMRAAHFDADSREAVLTLIKYVDNVVGRPGDARTRAIRCGNAAYCQKVGRIAGGRDFLLGVGFLPVVEGMSYEVARNPEAHTVLTLPPEREDAALLRRARALLTAEAVALGVPDDRIPSALRPPPPVSFGGAYGGGGGDGGYGGGGTVQFDPYRAMRITVGEAGAEAGGGYGGAPSVTEAKLGELRARREALEGGVPERELQVVLPPSATATTVSGGFGKGSGSGSSSRGGRDDMEIEESREDRALVAQRVARQLAERKKQEDVPFTTRAMRELEALQKTKVYAHAPAAEPTCAQTSWQLRWAPTAAVMVAAAPLVPAAAAVGAVAAGPRRCIRQGWHWPAVGRARMRAVQVVAVGHLRVAGGAAAGLAAARGRRGANPAGSSCGESRRGDILSSSGKKNN
ncbi:unnamed protein product [Phaeothamnion confervicola]